VKELRDKEKTSTAKTGDFSKLASGLEFAEFSKHKYAVHVSNYLNNF
jgi:hypothetical protein